MSVLGLQKVSLDILEGGTLVVHFWLTFGTQPLTSGTLLAHFFTVPGRVPLEWYTKLAQAISRQREQTFELGIYQ